MSTPERTDRAALLGEIERLQRIVAERDAEVERLWKALDWYSEKAEAIARYLEAKPPGLQAAEAVTTELALDAGKRALAASSGIAP